MYKYTQDGRKMKMQPATVKENFDGQKRVRFAANEDGSEHDWKYWLKIALIIALVILVAYGVYVFLFKNDNTGSPQRFGFRFY